MAAVSMPSGLPRRAPAGARWLGRAVVAVAALMLLWLVFSLYVAGQPFVASGVLVFGVSALVVYGTATSLAWKYLFPGVAGMLLFVAFPLLYTVQIGFTNYSSSNLLTQERARAYLLDQAVVDEDRAWAYAVHREGGSLRLLLAPTEDAEALSPGARLVTPPFAPTPRAADAPPLALEVADEATLRGSTPLPVREVIALRGVLQSLVLAVPSGLEVAAAGGAMHADTPTGDAPEAAPGLIRYAGLREFGPIAPLWRETPEGGLLQVASGTVFTANPTTGFFESAAGERMPPGFRVGIGLANYSRMLLDADFRGPFVSIFVWTVSFAGLTVLFATAIGMTLAVLLEWPALKGRTVYRTLLFLPYAVPGFISILVFKGLFNQNFGEINAILDFLFGIRPAWFADPTLARAMLLIVNTWLGYPYIMVLCTGLIKAIPADLYEASAIAGAGPLTNFFKITAPLILKPLTPLLISAFAFNFNNFVLISLLTDGRPDFLDTKLPAGTTDILVSYTYRIAFTDAGQNFGLAAAISTLIFVMVAVMALVQLRITHAGSDRR
jgi:maltose/maltodextrin transport system permease protein